MILGIELVTANPAVGVVDFGFPILLANGDGQRRLFALVGDVNRR